MKHRTIRGSIRYTSTKPERLGQERGREYFMMTDQFDGSWKLDDRLRSIPTHYHAHARGLAWGPDALRRR